MTLKQLNLVLNFVMKCPQDGSKIAPSCPKMPLSCHLGAPKIPPICLPGCFSIDVVKQRTTLYYVTRDLTNQKSRKVVHPNEQTKTQRRLCRVVLRLKRFFTSHGSLGAPPRDPPGPPPCISHQGNDNLFPKLLYCNNLPLLGSVDW